MYIPRALSPALMFAMEKFPSVIVTGPRQAGKTTFLTKTIKKKVKYISFDDPLNREFANEDPNGFLNQFEETSAILDEVQYVPNLFPYIKIRIDNNRNNFGKWTMTGSQQFRLMKDISETLAGRIAILNLLPFHSCVF